MIRLTNLWSVGKDERILAGWLRTDAESLAPG